MPGPGPSIGVSGDCAALEELAEDVSWSTVMPVTARAGS
jgi:hypothetical protein